MSVCPSFMDQISYSLIPLSFTAVVCRSHSCCCNASNAADRLRLSSPTKFWSFISLMDLCTSQLMNSSAPRQRVGVLCKCNVYELITSQFTNPTNIILTSLPSTLTMMRTSSESTPRSQPRGFLSENSSRSSQLTEFESASRAAVAAKYSASV